MGKNFKCKFCKFETPSLKKLQKHFKKQHNQKLKTNTQRLQLQVNKRLKESGNKAYAYQIIRKFGTFHENIVKNILKQNKSFFEFQPIVFSKELNTSISPDFFILSWKNARLKTPFYLEIDGNTKDRTNTYQIQRENCLKSKYPILRIWNKNVTDKYVIFLIEKFIKETINVLDKPL